MHIPFMELVQENDTPKMTVELIQGSISVFEVTEQGGRDMAKAFLLHGVTEVMQSSSLQNPQEIGLGWDAMWLFEVAFEQESKRLRKGQ